MVLRVKIEIVPFGDEDRAQEIGRLDIFNKGQIRRIGEHFEYGVINLSKGQEGLYQESVMHERKLGAWELVRRAILDLGIKGP